MDSATYPNGTPSGTSQTVTLDNELNVAGYVAGFATESVDGHSYIQKVTISNSNGSTVIFAKYDPDNPDAFIKIAQGSLGDIQATMGGTKGHSSYEPNGEETDYYTSLGFYLSHVEEDITVSVTYAPIEPYTLTFHRNYNASDETIVKQRDVYAEFTVGAAPQPPTRAGYTFLGWATSPTATKPIEWDEETPMGLADRDYYAVWKSDGSTPPAEETEKGSGNLDSPNNNVKNEAGANSDAVDTGDNAAALAATGAVCIIALAAAAGAALARRRS